MSNDNGGPAFPVNTENTHQAGACLPHEGMTLRDYFAAKAMSIMWDAYDKGYCGVIDPDTFDNRALAEGAYQIADAMIAERNKAKN